MRAVDEDRCAAVGAVVAEDMRLQEYDEVNSVDLWFVDCL
jgi:hypothetical protein